MYTLLPFQFFKFSDSEMLLVNECGDYCFLPIVEFERFIHHALPEHTDNFNKLKSKLFLAQEDIEIAIEKMAAKYRSRKAFLRDFTTLHMLVITLRCNQRCEYCQVSCAEEDAYKYDMPLHVAQKAIDIIFESPSKRLKIEFQGGEPLLNWNVLKQTVLYAEKKAIQKNKNAEFVICTNLTLINEEQLYFCKDHNIHLSTSLDGPKELHDKFRISRLGHSTYDHFYKKLELARRILGYNEVNALMTTTAFSLELLEKIVDKYIDVGMNGIFIRSLNPYGMAAEKSSVLGYSMNDFVEKYIQALKYIMQKNREVFFPEYFAVLLFSRILTPFSTGFVDLQSPAGTGISGVIYDYDGSVFPSDEARMLARMGDRYFCLGNVLSDKYQDIFYGNKLRSIIKNACVEVTPSCAYCVYQAYCGCDPVRNYLETGSEVRSMENSPFCIKHKSIFTELFNILHDKTDWEDAVIWSWITNNPKWVKRNENN